MCSVTSSVCTKLQRQKNSRFFFLFQIVAVKHDETNKIIVLPIDILEVFYNAPYFPSTLITQKQTKLNLIKLTFNENEAEDMQL